MLDFAGASEQTHTVVFVRNTTEGINRLARMFPLGPGDVVLSTQMEHHANDLPWRRRARVDHVAVSPEGELDLDDLDRKLRAPGRRVRLVTVTGASNVTGFVNPIHQIARLAHQQGARILVDAAQLAPHRAIRMTQPDADASIDFLAFSGHKLYAPYGAGALIAPLSFLEQAEPDQFGGGAVKIVSQQEVHLAGPPDRFEPGSPNVVGIVAMAAALNELRAHGMDHLAEHECTLTAYTLERLREIPGLRVYGSAGPGRTHDRLGVIAFDLADLPHGLVTAILATEGAIGVRNGCFCAHPYVVRLLGIGQEPYLAFRDAVLAGHRQDVPGLVRVSFGVYNTTVDVDHLVALLKRIVRGQYDTGYHIDTATGEYVNDGFQPDFGQYFRL